MSATSYPRQAYERTVFPSINNYSKLAIIHVILRQAHGIIVLTRPPLQHCSYIIDKHTLVLVPSKEAIILSSDSALLSLILNSAGTSCNAYQYMYM